MTMLADLVLDFRHAGRSLARTPRFTVVAAVVVSVNLTGDGGEPERLAGVRTASSMFATIGLAPMLRRTFVPEDGTGEPVVVSEGFWLRRLGGDPAAVGRTITLDGSPHTVVGVVPRDFRFPIAKLRTGVSLEAARAEMSSISTALRAESRARMT